MNRRPRGYLRVAEGMIALTIAKALIRFVPFERLRRVLGAAAQAHAETPLAQSRDPLPAAVGYALRRGSRRLPWYSSCLVRAVAGRMMLSWRGIPSTLVLGVATEAKSLHAHAWLVAGGGLVCGGKQAAAFHPLASFGHSLGPDEH